jgi:hypothetical protein
MKFTTKLTALFSAIILIIDAITSYINELEIKMEDEQVN